MGIVLVVRVVVLVVLVVVLSAALLPRMESGERSEAPTAEGDSSINNHAILFPNLIIITALLTGAPHATSPMPTETPLILKVIVWLVYPRWKHTRSYLVHRDSRLETEVSPGRLAEDLSRIRFIQ